MSSTLQNSFDLRLAQERMYQSELLIRKAWSTVLPRLNASLTYTFNWPRIAFTSVTQDQLDGQAAGQRAQLEGQAQIYDAQAEAARADGDYNSEYANRAVASNLRKQSAGVTAGTAPDPVAINPVNVFNGGLNFSMILFNGRSIPLLMNAYDTVKQTRMTITRARAQALYVVAVGYFNAVAAQRLAVIAQRQVDNLARHLEVTRVRVEVGTLPPLALRRAESDLERAKASVRTAHGAYQSAVASLGSAMGVDTAFDVGALPPVPDIEEKFGDEELIAHAESHRPDVQAARLAVKIAERNRVDAMMRWLPSVTLNANARATSNIRGFQKEPITYAVTVNAAIPLYDGGERYVAWRESGSQLREAHIALEQTQMRLAMGVRGNLREIRIRKENLNNQRLAKKLADEAVQDARARFEVGAATQLEVLDAEQLSVSAALDLTLAELELRTARLALAYVVGAFNPAASTGGTTVPTGISPVDLSALPPSTADTAVAHLVPNAPARAPMLAPPGRAMRHTAESNSGLGLTPSATDLLRAGLVDPVLGPLWQQ